MLFDLFQYVLLIVLCSIPFMIICPPIGEFIIGYGVVTGIFLVLFQEAAFAIVCPYMVLAILIILAIRLFLIWKKGEPRQFSIKKILKAGFGVAAILFIIPNFINIGLDRADPISFTGMSKVLVDYTLFVNEMSDMQMIIFWIAAGMILAVLDTVIITFLSRARSKKAEPEKNDTVNEIKPQEKAVDYREKPPIRIVRSDVEVQNDAADNNENGDELEI